MNTKIYSLIALLIIIFNAVDSHSATLGEVVRTAKGEVAYMSWQKAIAHCRDQGQRLPTIYEYAQSAKQSGAELVDTQYPQLSWNEDGGTGPQQLENELREMIVDRRMKWVVHFPKWRRHTWFYYSNRGYRAPTSDDWKDWFWAAPPTVDHNAGYVHAFQGERGYIVEGLASGLLFHSKIDSNEYDEPTTYVRTLVATRCAGD